MITEDFLQQEASDFVGRTGKIPTMLLIGYEDYLEFDLQFRRGLEQVHKRTPLPQGLSDIGHVETFVVNTGPIKFIVDPCNKRRCTFLVSNEFSVFNGGEMYPLPIIPIDQVTMKVTS
jgi:hypothetical protein